MKDSVAVLWKENLLSHSKVIVCCKVEKTFYHWRRKVLILCFINIQIVREWYIKMNLWAIETNKHRRHRQTSLKLCRLQVRGMSLVEFFARSILIPWSILITAYNIYPFKDQSLLLNHRPVQNGERVDSCVFQYCPPLGTCSLLLVKHVKR